MERDFNIHNWQAKYLVEDVDIQKQERYTVEAIHKFGMLIGYKIFDNRERKYLPYEYDDDQKDKAATRAELSNALEQLNRV